MEKLIDDNIETLTEWNEVFVFSMYNHLFHLDFEEVRITVQQWYRIIILKREVILKKVAYHASKSGDSLYTIDNTEYYLLIVSLYKSIGNRYILLNPFLLTTNKLSQIATTLRLISHLF